MNRKKNLPIYGKNLEGGKRKELRDSSEKSLEIKLAEFKSVQGKGSAGKEGGRPGEAEAGEQIRYILKAKKVILFYSSPK